jgi:SAM-dependent methyltransferase
MESPSSTRESLSVLTSRGPVPLGFVRNEREVYLIARNRSAVWPIDILRSGWASLRFPEGAVRRGAVDLVSDPAQQRRILALFETKYGTELFTRWYDHPARVLRVDLVNGRSDSPDQVYEGWIQAEFDNIAADYDHHILGNRINRLLRDRSLAWLQTAFAGSAHLLEIGCGSGMETLPMLHDGHEITAVDISERMLEVVREKARSRGLGERLRTIHLRARDLGRLVTELGPGAFDGAYSTYGALNCEPDLHPIASALADLLQPDDRFVAGVYNRWCLFEILGYALSFQPDRARGRWRNPVPVGASRFCVDVYAHSVPDLAQLFAADFVPVRVEGVPVLLPPSDLSTYAEKLSRHFDRWARWDARLGRRWPWRALGDHFLMTFVRR